MLGRGCHNDAAYVTVTRIEDVVEPMFEQAGRLGHTTVHNAVAAFVEIARKERCNGRSGMHSDLGRLCGLRCVGIGLYFSVVRE